MTCAGDLSDVVGLLARMQCLVSMTQRVEDDQSVRAQMLQLSRELTATLQQPDEVVSLVAFSVRNKYIEWNGMFPADRFRVTATCV
jgi:hypothetical protein